MTTVLLYWNHICVLHKGEKQFLDRLAERLSNEDIDLRVRYFGLGYPEHMSEYMARPDAILPDLIVSADLEVFEDSRIYRKLEKDLYPVTKWFPLRDGGALDAVRRDNRLLPFVSIPLVYYTRQPDICERTASRIGTAWPLAASTTLPPKRWLKQSGIDGGRRLPVACWKEVILRICRLARFRRFV